MILITLAAIPLATPAGRTLSSWSQVPAAGLLLPTIGLAMAPIYPVLNSAILSSVAPQRQPAMVGLIVVFSSLGGSIGSMLVGLSFAAVGPSIGFYTLLAPMALVALFGKANWWMPAWLGKALRVPASPAELAETRPAAADPVTAR